MRLLAALLAFAAASAGAQPAVIDPPLVVSGGLSPAALVGLTAECSRDATYGEGCVRTGPAQSSYARDTVVTTTGLYTPAEFEVTITVTAPAPARACAGAPEASGDGPRRVWEAYGTYRACVAVSPSREVRVEAGRTPESIDEALAVVDLDGLARAPEETAYVHPVMREVRWSPADAAAFAAETRPTLLRLAPPQALAALLPPPAEGVETRDVAGVETDYRSDGGPETAATFASRSYARGPEASFSYTSVFLEVFSLAAAPGRTRAALADVPPFETITEVRGVPALVEEPGPTAPSAPPPPGSPARPASGARAAPTPYYPDTVLYLGDSLRVHVSGRDSLLAAEVLARLDLGALRRIAPEAVPVPQPGSPVLGSSYAGAFALPDGGIRVGGEGAPTLTLDLPPGLSLTGVLPLRCNAGLAASERSEIAEERVALAIVHRGALDPCNGGGLDDLAEAARGGPLATFWGLGPAGETPLAWVAAWPGLRHALLPSWMWPLAPSGAVERETLTVGDAVVYGLAPEEGSYAAEATFFIHDGALVAVVAAAPDRTAARTFSRLLLRSLRP